MPTTRKHRCRVAFIISRIFSNLILKISHRVVYHKDSITLRILFSDDAG